MRIVVSHSIFRKIFLLLGKKTKNGLRYQHFLNKSAWITSLSSACFTSRISHSLPVNLHSLSSMGHAFKMWCAKESLGFPRYTPDVTISLSPHHLSISVSHFPRSIRCNLLDSEPRRVTDFEDMSVCSQNRLERREKWKCLFKFTLARWE